jgi:hypothetical protein
MPTADAAITLRHLIVAGATGATGVVVLPSLEATGTTNIRGNADIVLPSLEVTGLTGAIAEVELPGLIGTGTSIHGVIADADITLPKLVVVGTSSGPNITYAALELPSLIVTGTSIHDVIASAAVSLPSLWASGLASLADLEVISYALNLRAMGLSKYEGYNFNSLCVINGKSFGASSDGLYLLEGDDDEGVNIDAYATFPLTDFGEDNQKRVRSVHYGGTANKQMKLHVWANEGDERVRLFRPSTTKSKVMIPVGRGEKGEYWQFKVSNIRGADFEIDSLESFLVVLRRGGNIGS